ncbi:MAG: LysE family transporter [bacterium]
MIYESSRRGFKAGPLMIIGHAILEVAMMAVIIFGLAAFLHEPLVLKIIALLGAFILFAFGVTMIASIPKLSLDFKDGNKKQFNLIITGITMSAVNPYFAIWWLTIGLGLLLASHKQGIFALGVFFAGHILADLLWYSVVSLTISKGRRFISKKIYKGIIFVCGMTLVGFGIYFALNHRAFMP